MKVNNILFDNSFEKKFQKYKERITPKQRKDLSDKLEIFIQDIFSESLKNNKLSGWLKDYYSFRISYKDRLKFKLLAQ